MSLDNIKDITTTARNNLVNAIRTKGVSIADDSTINQCANAITLITGGGSVGGMKFYKCASVDTDNKTWSGYELVLQDGVYVVSDTLTEDLAYTGFKPAIDSIYNDTTTLVLSMFYSMTNIMPTDGLMFYASLSRLSDKAETGQDLIYSGTPVAEKKNGVDVIKFDNNTMFETRIDPNVGGSTIVSNELTISFYTYINPNLTSYESFFTTYEPGASGYYYARRFGIDSEYNLDIQDFPKVDLSAYKSAGLVHIALTFGDGKMNVYVNNECAANDISGSYDGVRSGLTIHSDSYHYAQDSTMYMTALRFYNRVLRSEEIELLSKEFKPTEQDVPDTETLQGCVFAANMQSNAAMYNGETINLEGITLADAPGYTDGTKALNKTRTTLYDMDSTLLKDGEISVSLSAYLGNTRADYSEYFIKLTREDGTEEVYFIQSKDGSYNLISDATWKASSGIGYVNSITPVPGWHHIIITASGAESLCRCYMDGVLVGEKNIYSPEYISLISKINVELFAANTYMKDLQIYNRVLLEDEITTLYEKAKLPIGV